MIDLYLFRHAESEMNEKNHLVGGRSNDARLSAHGEVQARSLGKRLGAQKILFDHVYCSPAVRTQQTARLALEELQCEYEPVIDERLLELSQGEWEGKPRTECYTPEVMKVLESQGWDFKAPGGESRKEVEQRMLDFINNEILSKYDKDKKISVAVFSHGMAIKCLLRGIMGFDQGMTFKTILDNTSISQLRFTEKGWFLERINDGAHITDSDAKKAYLECVYGNNR